MRKFSLIIVLLSISVFVTGCNLTGNNTDNTNDKDTKTASAKDTVVKNKGNFSYQPIKEDTFNYISKNFSENDLNSGKKVVLYANITDTTCPYARHFQETMGKYKNSESWNKSFKFINVDTQQSGQLRMKRDEYKEYQSYWSDCEYFCIVDLDKKLFFKGTDNTDEYVYKVLYDFYNK